MKNAFVLLTFMVIHLAIFALIGEGLSGPVTLDTVDPEITVTYPNGGELFYIGETHDIIWTATDFGFIENPISIDFSSNNGNDFSMLDSDLANSGTYAWEIPSTQSDFCKIKVSAIDNFGNLGEGMSTEAFAISYVPPAAPTFVNVDLSDEINAVISWANVDTTIFGTPITVDGYIVLYNETPYENEMQYYYFLGATNSGVLTYTHQRVAEFRDQMFYKIVAYKDYRGNMKNILTELTAQADKDALTWKEVKGRLQ